MGEWHGSTYVQSWVPQIRLLRYLCVGFTVVGAWAAVWFTSWWFFGDDWVSGPMPAAAWLGAGLSIALFGGVGVAGLWWTRNPGDLGLWIDRHRIEVRLLRYPVAFDWSEVAAVELRVQRVTRPAAGSASPRVLRTRTAIDIALAPAHGAFAERHGLRRLQVRARHPYTHAIGVVSTGPLTDSAERIEGLDQALRHLTGPKYAGLVEKEIRP